MVRNSICYIRLIETIRLKLIPYLYSSRLNYQNQLKEITNSINFFKKLKVYNNFFSVCYPYGGYNSSTVKILKKKNIAFALTTKLGSVNEVTIKNNFELPRYDTNDFKI